MSTKAVDDFSDLLNLSRIQTAPLIDAPIQEIAESPISNGPEPDDLLNALDYSPNFVPSPKTGIIPTAKRPTKISPHFIQKPDFRLLTPEYITRYDKQTLFLLFFYFPGTMQQRFASEELKKRGWEYSLTRMTWLRRVSNPLEETEDTILAKYEVLDATSANGWFIITELIHVKKSEFE